VPARAAPRQSARRPAPASRCRPQRLGPCCRCSACRSDGGRPTAASAVPLATARAPSCVPRAPRALRPRCRTGRGSANTHHCACSTLKRSSSSRTRRHFSQSTHCTHASCAAIAALTTRRSQILRKLKIVRACTLLREAMSFEATARGLFFAPSESLAVPPYLAYI
jgi:hypothetical protein